MKNTWLFIFCGFTLVANNLYAQSISLSKNTVEPVHVYLSLEKMKGKNVLKVIKDSSIKEVDEPTFVTIKGIDFKNGTIEVKVLSRLLKNAPDFARGFIGVAFRINDSSTKYESIYIRPVNARVDDQVRRNHSIQYYAYPGYKFYRLRKEAPERYEAYADMEMNKWITMRIEVKDAQAKLFLDNNKQPSLIVNDLKHGAGLSGAIGLWVEVGTEGYFTDLKIYQKN
ncbi:hypothetical protein QWZ08_21095 [Ferruginibacter paludis]|uniref:hypothetical protein n=1 Tax=Ferruginibacter paludis TaxID=1310417 RepID=UPI0025B56911|nr:hypothetical protein [Ferruginibacter paludis]MDN3658162.1 hypothetical protein [Ferruginibacter paludis]